MRNVMGVISAMLGVGVGVFSAGAEDAEWIATSTDIYSGSGANTKYNSDQYLVGKNWNTAACWSGNAIPGTTLGTVSFTNAVKTVIATVCSRLPGRTR